MSEDGSHQGNGNVEPEVHGPPLDSDISGEIPRQSMENSPRAASESKMQSKISEMHNNLLRHSPYGVWLSSGTSLIGNVDWRNEGPSRESSVHWSSLLPVSSVAGVVPTGKNIPNCGAKAPAVCRKSDTERIAESENNLLMKWKDTMDFRPGREHEQFNLWKMASLIRGISPSEKVKRKDLDIRDEMFHYGSSMDDGKIAERLWTFGQNEHHLKMKSVSASSTLSRPIFGSETGNIDLGPVSKSQLDGEKAAEGQLSDTNTAVMRCSGGPPADDQPEFVPHLKTVEQLPGNNSAVAFASKKLNHLHSSSHLFESSKNQHHMRTEDTETREMPVYHFDAVNRTKSVADTSHTVNNTGDKQVFSGSNRSLQEKDITSKCVGPSQLAALPAESASSGLAGLKAMHDKSSSVNVSEYSNNGSSLYRRRVKSLLLKQGNYLTEGFEAELPKSPRIQNHFESAFEHNDSSTGVAVSDNGCGNIHEDKCHQENKGEITSGTDVAVCPSVTPSDYKNEHVAGTGCLPGHPLEQEMVSKSDTLSGISGGVVNFATVNSEAMDKDHHPCVFSEDCCYTGQLSKDGMISVCVEKGLHVSGAGMCCHSGYGTVSHSACHCCPDLSSRVHLSPSCHLPIKVSPASAKCCVAHHLGSLPTPTRACAAALCQLSCSTIPSHAESPKGTDTSSGRHLSHLPKSGSQCTTPCHQAVVKCGCVGDGHLHQSVCPYSVKKSAVRGCSARIFHQDHGQQLGDTQPHTPCMAHTPYTPRETYTTREPDTPQESNGVCEPCTPHSVCSHRARKYPCTPTAACYFQFPPLHVSQLDCSSSGVCQSPCVSYARRLPPSCHTPCMSPLNLTIGQPCIAHPRTPQCCFQHQKLSSCTSHHRHNCVCSSVSFFACDLYNYYCYY